jgi:photosystem II stability/assembly factor-like uncharacterized protein
VIRSPFSIFSPCRAALAAVLCWFSATAGAVEWASVNPLPTGNDIQDVIWDGTAPPSGQFVAVGGGGLIMTSPDAATWTLRTSPSVQRLQKVIRGGSVYVAVGEGGAVLTSPDGSAWTVRSTNTRLTLYDIAWNGTVYVAVGAAGTILTSGNGITWTVQTLLPGPSFHGVLWTTINGGQFVAVGSSLGIATSPDGMTWTERSYIFGNAELRAIAEDGTNLVAVGEGFAVLTSTNGTAWSAPSNPPSVTPPTNPDPNRVLGFYGLEYIGGEFVAVGTANDVSAPTTKSVVATSVTGDSWSAPIDSDTTNTLRNIASSGSTYLLAGAGVLKTTSSVTGPWTTDVTQGSTANLAAIARYGEYVAVGSTGTILSSTDGLNWVDRTNPALTTANLHGVAVNTSIYVAVGDAGTVVTSTDAAAWSPAVSVPVATALYDVAWSSTYSLFIAVGAGGVILTSGDGSTWTSVTSPDSHDLHGVTTLHTPYVIAGAAGTILTSSNGTSWIKFTGTTTTNDLYDVSWTGSNFVAVGSAGTVLRSFDGVASWPSINIFSVGDGGAATTLRSVAGNGMPEGNGGQIVVVGDAASLTTPPTTPSVTIISSWLAATNTVGGAPFWRRQKTFSAPNLAGVAWDGSEFRAVGLGGAILHTGGIDVSVDITNVDHPSELVRVNDPYNYTFSVANVGNLNSNDILFQHDVPGNLLLGDVQPVSFQPGAGGLCLKSGNTIDCSNMIIPAGEPATSINITTTAATTGAITLSGAVAKPGETNTGNNVKSYDDTILSEIPPTPPKTVHSGATDLWLLASLTVCLLFQWRPAAPRGLQRTR